MCSGGRPSIVGLLLLVVVLPAIIICSGERMLTWTRLLESVVGLVGLLVGGMLMTDVRLGS